MPYSLRQDIHSPVLMMFGVMMASALAGGCSGDSKGASDDIGPKLELGTPDAAAGLDAGADTELPADGSQGPGAWVTIPAGSFFMGSPPDEPCHQQNEDRHEVTLTRSFEILNTEVTQGAFKALMGYNPSRFTDCGNECPVEEVDWHGAARYCNALSKAEGLAECYSCTGSGATGACLESPAYEGQKVYDCPGYRLPTEAEWEYAYRAGTTTALNNGTMDPDTCSLCLTEGNAELDPIGWYCDNSDQTPHPVGQKQPNAWHLYDMAGNVWEWCHDAYSENLGSAKATDPVVSTGWPRVLRGGSWYDEPGASRAAFRLNPERRRGASSGFRCVRTLD